jgi:hypothetical protein
MREIMRARIHEYGRIRHLKVRLLTRRQVSLSLSLSISESFAHAQAVTGFDNRGGRPYPVISVSYPVGIHGLDSLMAPYQ